MVRSMMHEDCYSSSTYASPELAIFCGFVSTDSTCPFGLVWNGAGTIGCSVFGEAFVDSSSQPFANDIASALVHSYEQVGVSALEKLNGWFCGVLVDLQQRKTILFNDRYGLSRIYLHEQEGTTYFSSEAKSLLAVVPKVRELDRRGLAEWFSCGCPLGNRTLFRGVSLLPSGSAWVSHADGSLKKESYFNSSTWEARPVLSPGDYDRKLTEVFPRILKRYTNGSRPMAMSLTGGLDGRMIMAWARPNNGELPCFTFNGSYRDCADVRIARKVATTCGQPHQTISVGDEFLSQFQKLAEDTVRITDGAMDVSGAAELYVNRLARQIAPVRLTGNYGSEILRGQVAFKPRALPSEVFCPDFAPQLAAAAHSYSEEAKGNQLSFIAFKQVPWHHYGRLAVEQSQVSIRTPFLDNDLVALAFQAPLELATSPAPSLRLIAEGNSLLGRIPTDRGVTYPAHRMSNRLHRSINEFLAKAEYAYDYGMPDWLARVDKYLTPFQLEKLFLGRQKFCHFRTWYRHQLGPYVKQVLLDPRARSRWYLNGSALEPLVNAHVSGVRNYTVEIHKFLSIELLHRSLLEH
jgi:asparagine synthase (glutamine-hydrolysing)